MEQKRKMQSLVELWLMCSWSSVDLQLYQMILRINALPKALPVEYINNLSNTPSHKTFLFFFQKMAEWTNAQIRILIDERRNRNDDFHDLGRDRKSFWNSIAVNINRETGTAFNGYQCKEKFSNLITPSVKTFRR